MFRDLVAVGWDCHIVMPERSPLEAEFTAAGVTLHTVPMRRITKSGSATYWLGYLLGWPIAELRLLALARRIDPGVVHSNSLHSWYGWAVARLLRRPHVWHAREIVIQSSSALRLEQWLTRHFAWKVIAVSQPVAAQLPGAPTMVIHDVPDPVEFSPERAGRFRERVGIDDRVRLIGAAGRIDTWKGFEVVLDAIESIRAARPDIELVVAGGPVTGKEEYAARLADRAASLPGVHWLGERTDVGDLLADLDAFVLASTNPEPFSTVLAEALASGVPVVGTDHGGTPEMLTDVPEDAGIVIAPNDPEALAAAVLRVTPAGTSSVEKRRGRTAMLLEEPTSFGDLFDEARHAQV
jgi:glycosyltransferase involved in cell wall biosynthesis